MKKRVVIMCFLLFFISVDCFCLAHPGRTDLNGGHYDRSTGEYHYHYGNSSGRIVSNSNQSFYNNMITNTNTSIVKNTSSNFARNTAKKISKKRSNSEIFWSTAVVVFLIIGIVLVIFFRISPFKKNKEK